MTHTFHPHGPAYLFGYGPVTIVANEGDTTYTLRDLTTNSTYTQAGREHDWTVNVHGDLLTREQYIHAHRKALTMAKRVMETAQRSLEAAEREYDNALRLGAA